MKSIIANLVGCCGCHRNQWLPMPITFWAWSLRLLPSYSWELISGAVWATWLFISSLSSFIAFHYYCEERKRVPTPGSPSNMSVHFGVVWDNLTQAPVILLIAALSSLWIKCFQDRSNDSRRQPIFTWKWWINARDSAQVINLVIILSYPAGNKSYFLFVLIPVF